MTAQPVYSKLVELTDVPALADGQGIVKIGGALAARTLVTDDDLAAVTSGDLADAPAGSPVDGQGWLRQAGAWVYAAIETPEGAQAKADAAGAAAEAASILKATVTSTGDLIAGDTAGAPARLAVGTDGDLLVADSSQTEGLRWATPAAALGGLISTIDQLPNPFYTAHRCGIYLAPEETIEAGEAALGYGAHILDWDCQILADNTLALMHDTTIDRTTSGSGDVADQTAASWKTLQVDASSWFAPTWPDTLGVPLLRDVLDRFGGKCVLNIQANPGTSDLLCSEIVARGLQRSVFLNSDDLTTIGDIKAGGCKAYYWPATTATLTTDRDDIIAAAPDMVELRTDMTDADLVAFIAAATIAGIPCSAGIVNRRHDRDRMLTAGCVGIVTNDVGYVSGGIPVAVADAWQLGTYPPGLIPNGNNDIRPSFVGGGGDLYRLQFPAASSVPTVLHGALSPLASATKTIDIFVTTDTIPSTNTRYFALTFWDSDLPVDFTSILGNGYQVNFRGDGGIQIYRNDKAAGGSATLLGSTIPGTAWTDGERRHLRVQITATQIIATDVTIGTTKTVTDSTYRVPWYLTSGKSDSDHVGVWSMDTLTVS